MWKGSVARSVSTDRVSGEGPEGLDESVTKETHVDLWADGAGAGDDARLVLPAVLLEPVAVLAEDVRATPAFAAARSLDEVHGNDDEVHGDDDPDDDRGTRESWCGMVVGELESWFEVSPLDLGLVAAMLTLYVEPTGVAVGEVLASAVEQQVESFVEDERDEASDELARVTGPQLEALLTALEGLGVVRRTEEAVFLTRLGTFGLQRWFESLGIEAPAVEALADATAMQVLEIGRCLEEAEEIQQLTGRWVTERGEGRAVEDLAQLARDGEREERSTAFALLDMIGEASAPAVRRLCEDPALRAHAVTWLAARGLHGPTPTEAEMRWVAVDAMADLLTFDPDELQLVLTHMTDSKSEPELAAMLGQMGESDHPQTAEALDLVAAHHPNAAISKAARKAAMKARSSR